MQVMPSWKRWASTHPGRAVAPDDGILSWERKSIEHRSLVGQEFGPFYGASLEQQRPGGDS